MQNVNMATSGKCNYRLNSLIVLVAPLCAPYLRVADQLRLCGNILLKWKVMEKQLLDASSVVTRCHPNVIECWLITPSAVTVIVLCYNYTTMDIRNNKYKEQFN